MSAVILSSVVILVALMMSTVSLLSTAAVAQTTLSPAVGANSTVNQTAITVITTASGNSSAVDYHDAASESSDAVEDEEETDEEPVDVGTARSSGKQADSVDTGADDDEVDSAAAAAGSAGASPLTSLPSFQSPVDFAALKADGDLMNSLTEYLGRFGIKLPKALITRVAETDLCAENAIDGLKCKLNFTVLLKTVCLTTIGLLEI